jgi:hypothetical protein
MTLHRASSPAQPSDARNAPSIRLSSKQSRPSPRPFCGSPKRITAPITARPRRAASTAALATAASTAAGSARTSFRSAATAAATAIVAACLPEPRRLAAPQCLQGLADLVLVPGVEAAKQCGQRRGPPKLLHWPIVPDEVEASLVDGVGAWLPPAFQISEVQHVLNARQVAASGHFWVMMLKK